MEDIIRKENEESMSINHIQGYNFVWGERETKRERYGAHVHAHKSKDKVASQRST